MNGENFFEVEGKFPSLNEYTRACRAHWSKGAKMKQENERLACWYIQQAKLNGTLENVDGPVVIHFEWREKTRRRDPDNVYFAKKFVLDAMQRMGVLPNDNQKYIVGLYSTISIADEYGVKVTIIPQNTLDTMTDK